LPGLDATADVSDVGVMSSMHDMGT